MKDSKSVNSKIKFYPGDLIMDRYEVLDRLNGGGICLVYKCFDKIANSKVVLKVVPQELSFNKVEMDDIKNKIQLVHNLNHPNILSSINLEKDSVNIFYYIIMDYVNGENLSDWMNRKRKDGTLTVEVILTVIRQIASALDYAHEKKVIHRNINPRNIIINSNNQIKILDFGIAAQLHAGMNRIGMFCLEANPYMAPEQWAGCAQGGASDQYSLAVIAYEMLAGYLPFECPNVKILREAVLTGKVNNIQDIPLFMNMALITAMDKAPECRFASCSVFADAISGNIQQLNSRNPIFVDKHSKTPDTKQNSTYLAKSNHSNKKSVNVNINVSYFIFLFLIVVLIIVYRKEICGIFTDASSSNKNTRTMMTENTASSDTFSQPNTNTAINIKRGKIDQKNITHETSATKTISITHSLNSLTYNNLAFYAPLSNSDNFIVTGALKTIHGKLSFTNENNIPCAFFDGHTYLIFDTNTIQHNPCTISLWVKCVKRNKYETTVFSSGKDILLSRNRGDLVIRNGKMNNYICNNLSFNCYQWNHILLTFSKALVRVYV